MAKIAFLGGTGEEGMGLALRFALAGEAVVIGSRQRERGEQAAAQVTALVPPGAPAAPIRGTDNTEAAREAEIVALAFPYKGVEPTLTDLGALIGDKIVLDVVNPLRFEAGLFHTIPVAAGSAAEHIRQLLPKAKVVSGFKNLSAKELIDAAQPLHGDCLLCGDVPEATDYFVRLVHRMPNLRAVNAGALVNARHLESITTLLLNLNRRYKALTSIEILGLKLGS